jgi:hypothetical protein
MADATFERPYVDVDEQRDSPLPHRYVHGGFEGTDTRFSFYLPPRDVYGGRFLQSLEGGQGGHESTATAPRGPSPGSSLSFVFACGAYLVESNQGHLGADPGPLDPTITAYRASAASARYAKSIAATMYGAEPARGYVYGASGGGMRTIQCLENCPDVWDGGVPFVPSATGPSMAVSSAVANFLRVAGANAAGVVDATAPGGSGAPFDHLTSEQRDALAAMYRAGFPRGTEHELARNSMSMGFVARFVANIADDDPAYFDDFWSVAGYLGADGGLAHCLVEEKASVRRLVTLGEVRERGRDAGVAMADASPDTPVGMVLDTEIPDPLVMITVADGRATGRELFCVDILDDVLIVGSLGGSPLPDVAVGDDVVVDNRKFLAYCYYHRYAVDPSRAEYAHFRVDGLSLYPTRPAPEWPGESSRARVTTTYHLVRPTGRFVGKMICLNNLADSAAIPNFTIGYQETVREQLGEDADAHHRLWFLEHAAHGPVRSMPAGSPPVAETRLIDYTGFVEHAIHDVIAWVEHDHAPVPSTGYERNEDLRLTPASAPSVRRGIQPVVAARANGGARADVSVGEPVSFDAEVEAPPGAGTVIRAEWDFDGTGSWPVVHAEVDGSSATARLRTTHAFDAPGTYYPTLRVWSHRDGDRDAAYGRLVNLARVRVVVR